MTHALSRTVQQLGIKVCRRLGQRGLWRRAGEGGGPGTETWEALTAQNDRRSLQTKEEASALSPGNSWKPEGTHLAVWTRLSRTWIRAVPSFFRLSKCFLFEVIWNKKKGPLPKAWQKILLCHFCGIREKETSYSIYYNCKWNVTLKRLMRKSLLLNFRQRPFKISWFS